GPAVQPDRAGIRTAGARQCPDQRRFAGAVLPEQRVHLAGAQAQPDPVQREHAGVLQAQFPRVQDAVCRRAHGDTSLMPQYWRDGSASRALACVNTDSSVMMRLAIGLPATTSFTADISCGP